MGIEKQRNFQFTTNIPLLDRTFTNLKHTTILIRVMLRAEEGRKRSDKFSIYLCTSNFKKMVSAFVKIIFRTKLTPFEWANFLLRIFFVKLCKMFRNLSINVNVYFY